MKAKRKSSEKVSSVPKKTSRTRKPDELSVDEWQRALRREFGQAQEFKFKNLGGDPVFSDFSVSNPARGTTYRVAVRGRKPGDNFCSCPDFSVNALGTCKHIEWLVAKLAKKRGGEKVFQTGYHPAYSSFYLSYGAQRVVRFRAGTECPPQVRALVSKYFDAEGRLRAGAEMDFETLVRAVGAVEHEVRVYDDVLAFVAQLRDDQERRNRIDQTFPQRNGGASLGKLLKVSLYPYQQTGAVFAARAGRCLLADDMGLGKTIQAIAASEILARTMGVSRVLVVSPTALKHQWKQEIERFTGRAGDVVEGLRAERARAYQADSFFKITNYDVIHQDLDYIDQWSPDLVILDEAQRIKNWQTRRAKAVKQIRSEYAIVLTGTPIENRLEELHSIMEFVDRFHLGPLYRFLHEHQLTDDTGKVIGYHALNRIQESLREVLLRRRKDDVLKELPARTDKHFLVDMTAEQWKHHDENQRLVADLVSKWKRKGFLSDKEQRILMVALQNMRMSCNSTFLLDKETDHSVKIDECAQLLGEILETPENKVVLFSQWLGTHKLLIRRLEPRGIGYAFYHGSLDRNGRRDAIDRFKGDPDCRILLCTDSGGVGLNLQAASVVINMDQPWNPAVLEQRIARVHRLGQHRPVSVYHFVSQGTIEQGMLNVLKFKSSVFAGVLDGGETEVFLGGTKMKKFMQRVEDVSGTTPDRMPVHEEPSPQEPLVEEVSTPSVEEPAAAAAVTTAASPWEELVTAGLSLLGRLEQSLGGTGAEQRAAVSVANLVVKNESTGVPELRIPMPSPEAGEKIADLLQGFAALLRAR